MANVSDRKNRRCCGENCSTNSFREPEMTRHSHPIRPAPPCSGEMNWIRRTLGSHTQLLTEILERLRALEGADK